MFWGYALVCLEGYSKDQQPESHCSNYLGILLNISSIQCSFYEDLQENFFDSYNQKKRNLFSGPGLVLSKWTCDFNLTMVLVLLCLSGRSDPNL